MKACNRFFATRKIAKSVLSARDVYADFADFADCFIAVWNMEFQKVGYIYQEETARNRKKICKFASY